MYQNRQFLIFNLSEVNKIDFTQILETSPSTLRISVDGTKSLVKWDSETEPSFVSLLIYKEGPYSYQEIIPILNSDIWTKPLEDGMIVP